MTIDTIETRTRDDSKRCLVAESTTCTVSSRLPTKRSLFGVVDHEKSMIYLKKELDAMIEADKKKWNFDFLTFNPLEPIESDQYNWNTIKPDEVIPEAYAMKRLHASLETTVDHRQHSCSREPEVCPENTNQAVTVPPKLTQTSILDYVKCKKRLSINNNHSKCEEKACEIKRYDELNDCEKCYPLPLLQPPNKKLRSSFH